MPKPPIRIAVAATLLLCASSQACFFSSCQKAIRAFLPWMGLSPEGLQFHWIQRELTQGLLATLENDTRSMMAAGLEPSDAFHSARRLSRRWLQDNPVQTGTAVFAAPRLREWVVETTPHTHDCLRHPAGTALELTAELRNEFTPRVADHFRRGPGSPAFATGLAETFLAKAFKIRRTYYTTQEHLPIATAVELRPQSTSRWRRQAHHLLLTPPENIEAVMSDVSRRLEAARSLPSSPETLDARLQLFTTAVYGYYQAYPFERGTHALGRALFRGFFFSLFSHDLTQWPDEDRILDFLVVSQSRFVDLMTPFFRESLISGPNP